MSNTSNGKVCMGVLPHVTETYRLDTCKATTGEAIRPHWDKAEPVVQPGWSLLAKTRLGISQVFSYQKKR